jgi:hypothetical protein
LPLLEESFPGKYVLCDLLCDAASVDEDDGGSDDEDGGETAFDDG